ncbi:hypothetical protein [Microbulbifer epialgicus]|uniref:Reverse transcriptase (RNA-dependent DNA polymerase) n=1 Tax=Microbulbifer epialgicus TaxID=393907 RepID=A0ABV4P4J4_9GAMM
MFTEQLSKYLYTHWPQLKEALTKGNYQPKVGRRVEILKTDGKLRKLGIPTVIDRFIQQAVAQVIRQLWKPMSHTGDHMLSNVIADLKNACLLGKRTSA